MMIRMMISMMYDAFEFAEGKYSSKSPCVEPKMIELCMSEAMSGK